MNASSAAARGQGGCRDRRQIAAQHRGALYRRGGDVRGLGDRVGHDPGQRALAQLAAQQPPQKGLFGFGRGGEERRNEFGAPRLRPLPDTAPISEKVASTPVTVSVGCGRCLRLRPQRGPADTDLALPQIT